MRPEELGGLAGLTAPPNRSAGSEECCGGSCNSWDPGDAVDLGWLGVAFHIENKTRLRALPEGQRDPLHPSESPWLCLCPQPSLTERTVDDHRQPPARYGAMGSALRGRLATVLIHHAGGHDQRHHARHKAMTPKRSLTRTTVAPHSGRATLSHEGNFTPVRPQKKFGLRSPLIFISFFYKNSHSNYFGLS